MTTMEQPVTHSRLMDLERLVTLLNGHLRALQRELDQIGARSSAPRPWLIWPHQRRNQLLMSAICNRRIRPNLRRHALNVSPTPR
ncbi:MAG: hypothetical protein NNA31_12295 [Nitrospira sp.]|nr:hypothetical protein [Nitrospira sp.]